MMRELVYWWHFLVILFTCMTVIGLNWIGRHLTGITDWFIHEGIMM